MSDSGLLEIIEKDFRRAFEFRVMLADILDFLEISERNIETLHKQEQHAIKRRAARGWNLPGDISNSAYEQHLLESAQHRFEVSLPTRVRYAALIALVTAVEWQAKP